MSRVRISFSSSPVTWPAQAMADLGHCPRAEPTPVLVLDDRDRTEFRRCVVELDRQDGCERSARPIIYRAIEDSVLPVARKGSGSSASSRRSRHSSRPPPDPIVTTLSPLGTRDEGSPRSKNVISGNRSHPEARLAPSRRSHSRTLTDYGQQPSWRTFSRLSRPEWGHAEQGRTGAPDNWLVRWSRGGPRRVARRARGGRGCCRRGKRLGGAAPRRSGYRKDDRGARALTRRVRDELSVTWGSCLADGSAPPFGPWRALVDFDLTDVPRETDAAVGATVSSCSQRSAINCVHWRSNDRASISSRTSNGPTWRPCCSSSTSTR